MKTLQYSAWSFLHPDLDHEGKEPGLSLNNRGGIALVEGSMAVRHAILLLLSTRPGERVMRPNYGCHLYRLLFSPNDGTTAGLAIHYVRQALERWEPRIEILHIDAGLAPDSRDLGLLEINLQYRLRSLLQTETLVYAFDLMGEQS